MHLIPLGTNGWFPSFDRHTASYVIPYGETLIILDAGSGLFRLAEPEGKKLLKQAKQIHLFLSHYHLDHTFGFYAADMLLKEKPVTVFGKSEKRVFSELPNLDYYPVDFEEKYGHFHWKKLNEGEHDMGNYQVKVRRQDHRGHGSLAFRFMLNFVPPPRWPKGTPRPACRQTGKVERQKQTNQICQTIAKHEKIAASSTTFTLAYITDSEPTDESVAFVKEADLLIHEHTFSGKNLLKKGAPRHKHILDGHVTTVGAALIAKEAKVKRLVLTHHNPFASTEQLKKEYLPLAQSIFTNTELAHDWQTIMVKPTPGVY